jgi:hypothetical protein
MISCKLFNCPPGLFIAGDCIGFKTEYRTESGLTDAYIVASGEAFWGGAKDADTRENLTVTPVGITDASALRLVPIPTDH